MGFSDKIVSLDTAAADAEHARSLGRTIVWSNGCFDLLHAGHVLGLEQAAAMGSHLVVGLNTDESVRNLKGPGRPVTGLQGRMTVVAALASVWRVVSFADPTPLNAILAIKPDVIVKGGDYTVEQVVGHQEVSQWGGRVEIVPLAPGWSTTATIAKLNQNAQQD